MSTLTGLDQLLSEKKFQDLCKGNLGYLCHSASVDQNLELGVYGLQRVFGSRLKKLFGPQHGIVSDVQANMIETKDTIHPYFKLPVHSLYSKTRIPTDEMLAGLNTVIVDLQDVGTRIYTYIYTLTLLMEACGKKDISVVVLDRPNPVGGIKIEGPVLDPQFSSFVGRHPIPVRHSLTIGEFAKLAKKYFHSECDLHVIPMKNWKRSFYFEDTGLSWVPPSPNLPTPTSCLTFVGTVIFEGTNISEGRGTTRSLEMIGHPKIEPFSLLEYLKEVFHSTSLEGFTLRPLYYLPTFDKYKGQSCGGFQIHVTHHDDFTPWAVGQILCRELYHCLGSDFSWSDPPYEYEHQKLPIDILNGTDLLRKWVESNGSFTDLLQLEKQALESFEEQRQDSLFYT